MVENIIWASTQARRTAWGKHTCILNYFERHTKLENDLYTGVRVRCNEKDITFTKMSIFLYSTRKRTQTIILTSESKHLQYKFMSLQNLHFVRLFVSLLFNRILN